jgi:hypothetical protein
VTDDAHRLVRLFEIFNFILRQLNVNRGCKHSALIPAPVSQLAKHTNGVGQVGN